MPRISLLLNAIISKWYGNGSLILIFPKKKIAIVLLLMYIKKRDSIKKERGE